MFSLERACAAALFSCLLAVPAVGALRSDALERTAAAAENLKQDVGPTGGFEHSEPLWLDGVTSGKAEAHQSHASNSLDMISGLITPAAHDGQPVLVLRNGKLSSAVPLPTGFSLFGAAILTLGLVGLWSGAQRQPALELGSLADSDRGPSGAEAAPATWFRIEIQGERGFQVRHTGSARGAIDLIADLLNDGWDLIRISDRAGLSMDYEDLIHAWRSERPNR